MRAEMSTKIPQAYDKELYASWHNSCIPEDADIIARLEKTREALKSSSSSSLAALSQLLTQIKAITEKECRVRFKGISQGQFLVPTSQFSEQPSNKSYDLLFKSSDSILEKLWRKNLRRSSNYASLSNLQLEITDLLRTSVVAPTLGHAHLFAERLESWLEIVDASDIETYLDEIDRVEVDMEAKLASGYFAYHIIVRVKSGLCIEVQIYSQLSEAWRSISHKLYETKRLKEESLTTRAGSAEARLVSLGHLLHLAECELDRLAVEFTKPQ
jgi:ppGpp synthetase/RelA/SpoT-type nucleotidyltranferase